MKKLAICAAGVVCVAMLASFAVAGEVHPEKATAMARGDHLNGTPAVRKLPTPISIGQSDGPTRTNPSTITYDTGTVTGTSSGPNKTWGNRFNTVSGNPFLAGGSVTSMTFWLNTVGGGAFVTFYDQLNTGASTANSINDILIPSASVTTGLNVAVPVTFGDQGGPVTYVGASVLAGVWHNSGGPDIAGIDSSGTVNGQGFHGMSILFGGGSYVPHTNTWSAIFRITGKNLPVELMSFSVDGE